MKIPTKLQVFLYQKKTLCHKWCYTCTYAVIGRIEENLWPIPVLLQALPNQVEVVEQKEKLGFIKINRKEAGLFDIFV